MPYCNHCGRFIESGALCDWCQEHTEHAEPEEQKDKVEEAPTQEIEVPQDMETPREDEENNAPSTPEIPETQVVEPTPEDGADTPVSQTPPPRKKRYFAAPLRHFSLPQGVRSILDTPDSSAAYTRRDAKEGKWMSVLCYLWVLWLIPFFAKRESPYVRYHLGQGLMLLLMDSLGATFIGIALLFGSILPVAAPAFTALGEVALLLSCLLKLFGVGCALQGKAKELPLVGSYGRHP